MPPKNYLFFTAGSWEKDINFGGHLKHISALLILSELYNHRNVPNLDPYTWWNTVLVETILAKSAQMLLVQQKFIKCLNCRHSQYVL